MAPIIKPLSLIIPTLLPLFGEKLERLFLGSMAMLPGVSVSALAKISHKSPNTIYKGRKEFCDSQNPKALEACFHNEETSVRAPFLNNYATANSARKMGAPSVDAKYPGFMDNLYDITSFFLYKGGEDGNTYVNASSRYIADELAKRDIYVSHATVDNKLHQIGLKCKKYSYTPLEQPSVSIYWKIEERFHKNGIMVFAYISLIAKYGYLGEILFYYASVFGIAVLEKRPLLALPSAEYHHSQRIESAYKRHQNSMNCVIQLPCGEQQLALPSADEYLTQRMKAAYARKKSSDSMPIPLPEGRNLLALPEGYYDCRTRQAHDRHKNPQIAQPFPLPPGRKLLALPQIEEKRAKRIKAAYSRHKVEDDKNPIVTPLLYIMGDVLAAILIIVAKLKGLHPGKKTFLEKKRKKYNRKKGGGRLTIEHKYPLLDYILYYLLDNHTFGDPEKPTFWCAVSMESLRRALEFFGIYVSTTTIRDRLRKLGFSLKRNKKMEQDGEKHPDANDQMIYINKRLEEYREVGYCIVSIDAKNKVMIGNYDNGKKSYCIDAPKVKTHDFCTNKATPFGVYVLNDNSAFVNLGISSDTGEFAVNSLQKWWNLFGCKNFHDVKTLVITADSGGSNSYRGRLFKRELQKFANESNLQIIVHHYPRGKSKYNRIEHRLFCHISNNWRDKTLTSLDVILNLIRNTTTQKGLRVEASLDENVYRTGIKISKKELDQELLIVRDAFHGDWNYTLYPESRRNEYLKRIQEQEKEKTVA